MLQMNNGIYIIWPLVSLCLHYLWLSVFLTMLQLYSLAFENMMLPLPFRAFVRLFSLLRPLYSRYSHTPLWFRLLLKCNLLEKVFARQSILNCTCFPFYFLSWFFLYCTYHFMAFYWNNYMVNVLFPLL